MRGDVVEVDWRACHLDPQEISVLDELLDVWLCLRWRLKSHHSLPWRALKHLRDRFVAQSEKRRLYIQLAVRDCLWRHSSAERSEEDLEAMFVLHMEELVGLIERNDIAHEIR